MDENKFLKMSLNFPDVSSYFTSSKNYEAEKRDLLSELISIVREVQLKYSGKKELASESDPSVFKLCEAWEKVVCHGIKLNLLGNVTELFESNKQKQFWVFALKQLTNHEQERYQSLKNIWTERGKTKALIRSSLNEQSLERNLLIWLSLGKELTEFYESYALMRDEKSIDLLPKLASDLNKVLFAIPIDQADLNVSAPVNIKSSNKPEPRIVSSPPTSSKIKIGGNTREIDCFAETSNSKTETIQHFVRPVQHLEQKEKEKPPVLDPDLDFNFKRSEEKINLIRNSIGSSTSSLSSSASSEINSIESAAKNEFQKPLEVEEKRSLSSRASSSISTASSKPSEPPPSNVTVTPTLNSNEEKLKERILLLESQVSELQIENRRLKSLIDSPRINSLSNFTVSIPKAVLKKSTTKNYYNYEIIIKSKCDLEEWIVYKRYRDFYNLHKKLRKEHLTVKALDFPPKKKLGNMDFDFVEQRRQRLQVYLRSIFSLLPEISCCDSRQSLEEKFNFIK